MIGTKGTILYKFKGMSMKPDGGEVVDVDSNRIAVKREHDNFLSNFVLKQSRWLLENNDEPTSLLYGTEFVTNEQQTVQR